MMLFEALRGRWRLPSVGRANLTGWTRRGCREDADAENRDSVGVLVRALDDEGVAASSAAFPRRPALPVESEGRERVLWNRLVVLYPGLLSDSKSVQSFRSWSGPPWSRVAA